MLIHLPNTHYSHQKITEQIVAPDSSNRSTSSFNIVRLFCFSYSQSTKVVCPVVLLFTEICLSSEYSRGFYNWVIVTKAC